MELGELSAEYDHICEEADELFKKYDPCQFKDGKCTKDWSDGCCGGCSHLGPNGCATKSLGCKLFTCGGVMWREKYGNLLSELVGLKMAAREILPWGVTMCRINKEQYFRTVEVFKKTKRKGASNG